MSIRQLEDNSVPPRRADPRLFLGSDVAGEKVHIALGLTVLDRANDARPPTVCARHARDRASRMCIAVP